MTKTRYEELLSVSPQATIFCEPWWLETVAPGRTRILEVDQGGVLQAAWPLMERRAWWGRRLTTPPLTPWLGVLFRPTDDKLPTRLSREKDLVNELVARLPRCGVLRARFHRAFTYWSPFHWHGFEQTTRYTYVLEDLSSPDRLWEGLQKNIRSDIQKATAEGVTVGTIPVERFWEVHQKTFRRQGLDVPYDFDLVKRLDTACESRNVRRIFAGIGKDGAVHAAAYVVWDRRSAYYLMGGGDPELRNSGATSLVLWEAIKFAAGVAPAFDFEGSMMEPVERFFRGFGATPCPYFVLQRVTNPLAVVGLALRNLACCFRKAPKE